MKRTILALFCPLTVVLFSATACRSQPNRTNSPAFDGYWWTQAPSSERDGFVAGFIDCYRYELKGPAHFVAKSLETYRDMVSRYFSSDTANLRNSVFDALLASADRPGERPPVGGEVWKEPHSYFDGDYWLQAYAAGGTAEQVGFVEGYVACSNRGPGAKRFSAPPGEYARQISEWYGFDQATGDMNPDREKAKIADVLSSLRKTNHQ